MKILNSKILIISINILFCILDTELVLSMAVTNRDIHQKQASPTKYPVVYQRYVRRRPSNIPNDKYVDEYWEIWNKPPRKFTPMTDDEVDEFIECDFNRHLEKCQKYFAKRSTTPLPLATSKNTAQPETTAATPVFGTKPGSNVKPERENPIESPDIELIPNPVPETELGEDDDIDEEVNDDYDDADADHNAEDDEVDDDDDDAESTVPDDYNDEDNELFT